MSERSSTASAGVVPRGLNASRCSGDMYGNVPPTKARLDFALRRADRVLDGQVEVEQHRRAVGRQQDVRRLQVAVEQSPGVGVLEALGKPRHDPDRSLDGAGSAQELA